MHRVYFDNNATSPMLPEVWEAMRPYFYEQFGNASSIHHHGQQTRAAVEKARESVAKLINCRAAEIVFTSGGTEADNLAIFGLVTPGSFDKGDHIVTTTIEHSAVSRTCRRLQALGCEVTFVPVDGHCTVNPDDIKRAIRPNTKLISVMMANNETGAIQPVEEIGRIAAEADIYFHTDAVQAAGKIPIDVEKIQCDLLSLSGHKIHGGQGIGAMYLRKGTLVNQVMYGGTHERGRRAGTENVPGIVALGKACDIAREGFENGEVERLRQMRDRFEQGILEAVEQCGVNGAGAPRVPTTSNIHFDHIEGEALIIALDLKGLSASSGAACSSGSIEPSPILLAMGLKPEIARSSLRFSMGKQNKMEDVDFALSIIPQEVARLRELSPVWKKQTAQAVS